MSRLEDIAPDRWQELTSAPFAVLVLGKTDCPACADWSAELERFLEQDREFEHVRFGKIMLDRPGFGSFKKANPWLTELDVLPYTQLYRNGERVKGFAGGGIERLTNRLRKS